MEVITTVDFETLLEACTYVEDLEGETGTLVELDTGVRVPGGGSLELVEWLETITVLLDNFEEEELLVTVTETEVDELPERMTEWEDDGQGVTDGVYVDLSVDREELECPATLEVVDGVGITEGFAVLDKGPVEDVFIEPTGVLDEPRLLE